MELWLDTAEIEIVREIYKMGLLTGVTTNPSILAITKRLPEAVIEELLNVQSGPVAVQVTAASSIDIVQQAKKLRAFSTRLIIKIPATPDGYEAMSILNQENIPVMATAILKASQVLLANAVKAQYAAPYLGRMLQENSDDEFKDIFSMKQQQEMPIKIIAAAIRDVEQVIMCAKLGVSAVTLPSEVFLDLITPTKTTQKCLLKFAEDWENSHIKSELFAINKENTRFPQ